MNLWRNGPPGLIDDLLYTGQLAVLALGDEDHLVIGLATEMAREMQVLSGEILVNNEYFHVTTRVPERNDYVDVINKSWAST